MRNRLYIAAHQEVKTLISSLPRPLHIHAKSLPVHFEMKPRAFEVKAGITDDTLGLFEGDTFSDAASAGASTPSHIILFMENIWDYARHDAAEFREEIRRTYLHELGHYLGLDEDDLVKRALD